LGLSNTSIIGSIVKVSP